jgi:hypothetical protein
MNPTWLMAWCMAEREGFEPSVPILSEHTISNRAPSASRASLRDLILSLYTLGFYLIPLTYRLAPRERDVLARFAHSASPRSSGGRRTLGPDFVGTHDFQSCPFSLSGISPCFTGSHARFKLHGVLNYVEFRAIAMHPTW